MENLAVRDSFPEYVPFKILPNERKAAIEWYSKKILAAQKLGPDTLHETERWLARNDLFYLMVAVLKRADVNRDWLFERCREVQQNPNGYIDLWAREHYKSSIITCGLTIQDILNDPEITVGIFSHTRPQAKAFLRHIKREFEGNEDLLRLFPEICWKDPQHQSPKWSEDDGCIVRRKTNPPEATFEAWGLVDGQPIGKHFRILIYDDVVTDKSVTNPEMIAKTNSAWALSLNLGTAGGVRRHIGTFYHFNDTYHEILNRKAAEPRIYPATDDGTLDGEPVLLTHEALQDKRREYGPYIYGCQMLLDPVADKAQGFQKEWLGFWPARNVQGLNLYIVCDPASKKKAHSDYTAMFVVGLGEDGNYRVVDMVRDRINLTERADQIFKWHRQYKPLLVGYEEYGLQADIEHIKDRQNRENYNFHVIPLGGKIKKEDRIRRLVPLFEQNRILLPDVCWKRNYEGENEDLTKIFINEEYLPFPVSHHDDMLDALSRIVDPDLSLKAPGLRVSKVGPSKTNTSMKKLRGRR